MSVEVLDIELERRRQELQREREENDRARSIRAELLQPEQPPIRVIYPLKDPERGAADECADIVRGWWETRAPLRMVTNVEIGRLVARLRRMGRGPGRK